MILGIGVDMVSIDEMKRLMNVLGEGGLGHMFTAEELSDSAKRAEPASFLAGRFAVKEAVFKALSPLLIGEDRAAFDLRRVETRSRQDGSPYIYENFVLAELMEKTGVNHIHVSITNERDCAAAFVIAERVEGR